MEWWSDGAMGCTECRMSNAELSWIGRPSRGLSNQSEAGIVAGVQTRTILIDGKKAVPIPDAVLEQCPLGDVVDVSAVPGGVLVKSAGRKPREGWEEAMRQMRERGDDLTPELMEWEQTRDEWDDKEWRWPGTEENEKV